LKLNILKGVPNVDAPIPKVEVKTISEDAAVDLTDAMNLGPDGTVTPGICITHHRDTCEEL
jgi:hypothetical protein